jgi:hypothetical protein
LISDRVADVDVNSVSLMLKLACRPTCNDRHKYKRKYLLESGTLAILTNKNWEVGSMRYSGKRSNPNTDMQGYYN